jgi:hypothetical protein
MEVINRATFCIISAPKTINEFMKACDLFEQGKVLGTPEQIVISYLPEVELTLQRAAQALIHLKNAYEHNKSIVSLVHLLYIERANIIEVNKGIIPPYWNKDVRICSTGTQWFLLDNFLRSLGCTVTTDEYRYITDAK